VKYEGSQSGMWLCFSTCLQEQFVLRVRVFVHCTFYTAVCEDQGNDYPQSLLLVVLYFQMLSYVVHVVERCAGFVPSVQQKSSGLKFSKS
jgi:hypothetical protein